MTQQELETSYNELSRLADELRAQTDTKSGDKLQRVLAQLGYVLARMGKIVAETKGQVDEIAYRERSRDRGTFSLRDERAIRFFAQLKPEARERLVQAIESGPPQISVQDFSLAIEKKENVSSWNVNDLLQFVGQWYSYLSQRESEEDVNHVASRLTDAFPYDPATAELLRAVDAANPTSPFTQQLKRLLRCHSTLGVTIKAEELLGRNERQYNRATVSTDIRPIFGGKVETAPSFGIVVHDLVLTINDGGTYRAIGVALTSSDILKLAEVLDRAWKKEDTLRKHAPYKLLKPMSLG
jgi:hypothetical protein